MRSPESLSSAEIVKTSVEIVNSDYRDIASRELKGVAICVNLLMFGGYPPV